mmetsp:Transcript_37514/g.113349  ORF Transcript_37514/g.113349 Transcript_37514/m.113349 type:complete len:207 (-) Transcript_37514:232-852(-)
MGLDARLLCPLVQLPLPLLEEGQRCHDEEARPLASEPQAREEGSCLHGLAQAHLICQNAAEALLVKIPHPRHALALVAVEPLVHLPRQPHLRARHTQGADVAGHVPLLRGLRRQTAAPDVSSRRHDDRLRIGLHRDELEALGWGLLDGREQRVLRVRRREERFVSRHGRLHGRRQRVLRVRRRSQRVSGLHGRLPRAVQGVTAVIL